MYEPASAAAGDKFHQRGLGFAHGTYNRRVLTQRMASAGFDNSVRIRLTDFLNNGSGIDLTDIVAVRFDFGAAYGSERGRIGVDDIEITIAP